MRGAFTKEQRIQCRKLLRTHPCYTNAMVAYTNGLTTRLVGEGSIPNDGEGHYDGRLRMAFHDQCANGRKRTIARRRALVSAAAAAHAHFRSPSCVGPSCI